MNGRQRGAIMSGFVVILLIMLYPCRRMPICVGNLMETPLAELYYQADLFRELRDQGRISDGCDGCMFTKLCRGGLKCLSYAVTGVPFTADPGCWLRRDPGDSKSPMIATEAIATLENRECCETAKEEMP